MDGPEKNIFNLQLDREAANSIFSICKMIQWFIVINVVIGLVHVTYHILSIEHANPRRYAGRPAMRLEYLYEPYFWLFFDVLCFVQIYVFWTFRKAMKRAVSELDNHAFNSSFNQLLRIMRLNVILSVLDLPFAVFALVLHIKYFSSAG